MTTTPRTEKITKTNQRQHWLVDETGLVVGGPYETMTKANNALRRFFPAEKYGGYDVATSTGSCGHEVLPDLVCEECDRVCCFDCANGPHNIYRCRACQAAENEQ